jgi:hypothetical protein
MGSTKMSRRRLGRVFAIKSLSLGVLGLGFAFSSLVFSEPWMASRYAQNCAACHSPGRVNVQAKSRRCSLSCQGCHTNPNGGGLRSFYGKWTEERWLNSFYVHGYKLNKPRPAPTEDQFYVEKRLKRFLAKANEKTKNAAVTKGFRLKETSARLPDQAYDRHTTGEKVFVSDRDELYRIPTNDPYRERRQNYFNAGLDFRYFYLDWKQDTTHTKQSFPMATDIAVSVEPVHRLTLVWEGRFLNNPANAAWDQAYTTTSQVRSAYAMVDDLPYNTFAMFGIYRPLFGQYNPDHTSLFASATGLDMQSYFKAVSVGTAPNVPFFNVHYLTPFANHSAPQDTGVVVNAGARFVTLGAYGMLSYWNTSDKDWNAGIQNKKHMYSFTGGFTWHDLTMVADLTRVEREKDLRKDTGVVMTLEPRYRFWRESYIKASYETLNTSRNLYTGKTNQMGVGISSFLISGIEAEIMYKDSKEVQHEPSDYSLHEKFVWFQTHFFF